MKQYLSKLFLEMESEIGTRGLATEVLKALDKAVDDFKLEDDTQFCKQFYKLIKDIKNTQPRIGLIIDEFYKIWKHLEDNKKKDTRKCIKQTVKKKIHEISIDQNIKRKKIINHGSDIIKKGDTILLHSHSSTVLDILKYSAKQRSFKCIVAEQDYSKTQALIRDLKKQRISFNVVPEYMLSHIEKMVDKVFLGAVTLNSYCHIVGDAGMNALVSEFSGKVPIYLFMSSSKFSYWKAKTLHHSFRQKQVKSHIYDQFTYSRIKYSHDRSPLDSYNYVVTEDGIFTSKDMKDWYNKKYEERTTWRKIFIR